MRHSIVNQTALGDTKLSRPLRDIVSQRVKQILGRVASRIQQTSIVITDENGPRGGVDKNCRVKVSLRGLGSITTTGRHEHLLGAIDIALQRARRIILKRLNRRKTRARLPLDTFATVSEASEDLLLN